jgi:hypothetical protein
MPRIQKIAPCLWFDDQAEDAAKYYTGIFENSRIDFCDTQKVMDCFWEKPRPADGGGTRV